MVAYDKIKSNVNGMNKSAIDAMKSVAEYAPEVKHLISESEKRTAEMESKLVPVDSIKGRNDSLEVI